MVRGTGAVLVGAVLACCFLAGPSFLSIPAKPQVALRGALDTGASQAPRQASPGKAAGILAIVAPVALAGLALAARRGGLPRRAEVVASRAFDPSAEIGAMEPLGFWDPCGFMKNADEAKFKDYRAKELKHGRVAMLATMGFLVQPFAKSANIGFDVPVPGGVQAVTTYPASAGLGALILVAGFFELKFLPDLETAEPGNFQDPLKFSGNSFGAYDEQWRSFEINNGRLAMFGAIGSMAAGYATGLDSYQQWGGAKAATIAFIKTTIPFAP